MSPRREQWAAGIAEHAAVIVRNLRRRGTGYAEVRVMLPQAEALFSSALSAIGTVPMDRTEELSHVVLDDGLSVTSALISMGF